METKNARKPSNVFVLASFIFIDPKLRPISHANVSPIPTAINPDKDFITLLLLLPLKWCSHNGKAIPRRSDEWLKTTPSSLLLFFSYCYVLWIMGEENVFGPLPGDRAGKTPTTFQKQYPTIAGILPRPVNTATCKHRDLSLHRDLTISNEVWWWTITIGRLVFQTLVKSRIMNYDDL